MRRFIPCIIWIALVPSCVRRPPTIQFGPGGPLSRPEEVLQRLEEAEQTVQSLKGDARLTVDSPEARGTVSMLVAVAPGGKLHLETLDFFGRPQAVLVSDGQRFGLFQGQEGRYYQGPSTAENLARFLPIALPPEELAALLLGRAPRLSEASVGALEVDRAEGGYRLTLTRGAAVQTLWVDTQSFRALQSETRGVRGYDLRLDDFFTRNNLRFPRQLTLKAAAAHTTLTLRYGDVTLNGAEEPGMFALHAPAGVPVVDVDEGGVPLSSPSTAH